MKYVLLVPDGMADEPHPDLDGKTPMQTARKPVMDELARKGTVGIVNVTPRGMYPGSDCANMALLGYDPRVHYTGRGPIEAASLRVPMNPDDVAFRCSVCSTDGENLTDYCAGHIETPESSVLIEAARRICPTKTRLFVGHQYRHILTWADGPIELRTLPPHENMNRRIEEIWPTGEGESLLRRFIWDSVELLDNHEINRIRRGEGKPPANLLWPWGQGRMPKLESFAWTHNATGAVVAAVDVIQGLGVLTGLTVLQVPGATGYFDTDYGAKANAAAKALETHDFVWVHVEAPDEAGHAGSLDEKIRAIENIDRKLLKPLLDKLAARGEFKVLIVPDHATPVATRGHKEGPVPWLLYDSRLHSNNSMPFDERIYNEPVTQVREGFRLLDRLFDQN